MSSAGDEVATTIARRLEQAAAAKEVGRALAAASVRGLTVGGVVLEERTLVDPYRRLPGTLVIVVHRRDARRAFRALIDLGYSFADGNAPHWPLRGASFHRARVPVRLVWRLSLPGLAARRRRSLERGLWRHASYDASSTLWIPDLPSLIAYLLVCASTGSSSAGADDLLRAAIGSVTSWAPVMDVADRAGVLPRCRALLEGTAPGAGAGGTAAYRRAGPGAVLARASRTAPPSLLRLAARATAPPGRTVLVGGRRLLAPPGVYLPGSHAERAAEVVLLAVSGTARPLVVEVGTGTGAIAVGVAASRPEATIHAVDTSARAVRAARRNSAGHPGVLVHRGSLFEPLPHSLEGGVHCIVCTLPNAADDGREPAAWVSHLWVGHGADGLQLLRRVAAEGRRWLTKGGTLVCQVPASTSASWNKALVGLGYDPEPVEAEGAGDLVLSARWPGR